MRYALIFVCIVVAAAGAACSSRQLYDTGQSWQQNDCNKIVDNQERQRCQSDASKSYDTYQRQRQDVQK